MLINDPKILELNETQLFFEAESINIEAEKKYEDMALVARAAKKAVISLLGLNIMPVEDSVTGLLRMPEDHEVIPLIAAIGHEGILKEVKQRFEDMEAQDLALDQVDKEKELGEEVATDDFLEFMDSDLEFIDDAEVNRLAVVNSPEYNYISKNIVQKMGDKEKEGFKKLFGFEPAVNSEDIKKILPDLAVKSVEIEPEKVEPEIIIDPPLNQRKVQITIEPDDDE